MIPTLTTVPTDIYYLTLFRVLYYSHTLSGILSGMGSGISCITSHMQVFLCICEILFGK